MTEHDLRGQLEAIRERLQHIEDAVVRGRNGQRPITERVRELEVKAQGAEAVRHTVEDNRVAAAVTTSLEQARSEWTRSLRQWVLVGFTAGGALAGAIGAIVALAQGAGG